MSTPVVPLGDTTDPAIPRLASDVDGSDQGLIASALHGDEVAFATIMSRNNARLYRVAIGILRDDGEAQDAMQEAYLHAFVALPQFRGESSLSTWLTRILLNEALGRLRRQRRTDADLTETLAEILDMRESPHDPERAAAQQELQRVIARAVDALPAIFQSVFKLRALEHLTVEETATRLGIPRETVKTRHHRAKRLLQDMLGEEFKTVLQNGFPFEGTHCRALTDRVLKRRRLGHGNLIDTPQTS